MWRPLLLVSVLLSTSTAAVVQPSDSTGDRGRLLMITVTADLVEGKYQSGDSGIHFVSKDGGVSITMLGEGDTEEPLFVVFRPDGVNTASIATILDKQFLLLNKSDATELGDYIIPPSMSARAKEAVESPDPKKLERLVPDLTEDTTANQEDVIDQLLAHPDTYLIIDAAVAMGNAEIIGTQYPAALPFYMLALQLAKRSPESEVQVDSQLPSYRSKRIVWWWQRTERCSNNGRRCRVGRCPRGSNCIGLCGRGCSCWWWVCFDCCWHWGCDRHDRWCRAGTFVCWVTAPIGLVC